MTTFADVCGHSNKTIKNVRRYHSIVSDLTFLYKHKKDEEIRVRTVAAEKFGSILTNADAREHIDSSSDAEELESYVEYLQKAGAKYDEKHWPAKRYALVILCHGVFWFLVYQLLPHTPLIPAVGMFLTVALDRIGILTHVLFAITLILCWNTMQQRKKNVDL